MRILLLALALALAAATTADAASFSNTTSIIENGSGAGSPYASEIAVSGEGAITDVNVTLSGVTHSGPYDLSILLVSPHGTAVKLMDENCNRADVNDYAWTLDDEAAAPMPPGGYPCGGSAYRPNRQTDWTMPVPAPQTGYKAKLSDFDSENPNGTWKLYVAGHTNNYGDGQIVHGWVLTLTTATPDALLPGSGTFGQSGPTPVTRTVTGVTGVVTDVDVVLRGIWHQRPDDLDLLLTNPTGTGVLLMSDACGTTEVAGANWEFDDEAPAVMNDSVTCGATRYRPTNWGAGDTWPTLPAQGWSGGLSSFDFTEPNGAWKLYAQDDESGAVGFARNRFELQLTTRPRATVAMAEAAVTLAEGTAGTLDITRTGPAATGSATVWVKTVEGTAGAGDYTPINDPVTFFPGETTKTIAIEALADTDKEEAEEFTVLLSQAYGDAQLSAPTTTNVTIPAAGGGATGGGGGATPTPEPAATATAIAEATPTATPTVTPPPALVDVTVKARRRAGRRKTRFRLTITKPAEAIVELRCAPKRRCPFTAGPAKRRLTLKRGTTLEVRVTQPGAIGFVVRYKVRARRLPRPQRLCLPPGATTPVRCA